LETTKIEASFSGGDVSTDGGIMVLQAANHFTRMCKVLEAVLEDPRNPDLIHSPPDGSSA
jgi:hypothetical protein